MSGCSLIGKKPTPAVDLVIDNRQGVEIPEALFESCIPDADVPRTYGELRGYTFVLLGALKRCDKDKATIKALIE